MIKHILFFVFIFSNTIHLQAEDPPRSTDIVNQSNGYYSFGGGFPSLVTFSAGHRWQDNHHGFDFGLGTTPLLFATEVHLYTNVLYYPKPSSESQMYYGFGSNYGYVAITGKWGDGIGFIKPHFIFGKEYMKGEKEKRFLQAEIGPAYFTTKGSGIIPSLTVTYGIYF